MFTIDKNTLESFAATLLQAGGFTQEEAGITAQSLVLSNLYGHDSHGVIRIIEYLSSLADGEIVSGVDLRVENETNNSLCADACFGLGQVQMPRLLDALMAKLPGNGVVTGSLYNCSHVGRLGEWTEYIAHKGLAGFTLANDNGVVEFVAPPGGKTARTSTNPIAFAVPLQNGEIFSLDMSTSATAMGKVRLSYLAHQDCPAGVLQDSNGNSTNDPAVLYNDPKGSVLPMGGAQGYKGFGLSMMVDCLVAGLSGGFTPPAPADSLYCNNVIACIWDPAQFAGLAHMQQQAEKYLDYVRQTPPIDPAKPVRIAGDRSKQEKAKRLKDGIPLSLATGQRLAKYAGKFGVALPDEFPD
ncbi:MAG: Ldh family oxidoreductase [Rhodospirillales bacterium]|nr:Ldh family oxidoreductase [Rhodospirillales bacterium]